MAEQSCRSMAFAGNIVLANEVIEGHVLVEGGTITAIDSGRAPRNAI